MDYFEIEVMHSLESELSYRQRQIVMLVQKGLVHKQIANELNISLRTFYRERTRIKKIFSEVAKNSQKVWSINEECLN